jgi:hypothetical protein
MSNSNEDTSGVVMHPQLGAIQLGHSVADVTLKPNERRNASNVLRAYGAALAIEQVNFIRKYLDSEDQEKQKMAVQLLKSTMPYIAQKQPNMNIQVNEDNGAVKQSTKQAIFDILRGEAQEVEAEVVEDR